MKIEDTLNSEDIKKIGYAKEAMDEHTTKLFAQQSLNGIRIIEDKNLKGKEFYIMVSPKFKIEIELCIEKSKIKIRSRINTGI